MPRIGTTLVPATESKVAVFALATVDRDGTPIAAGVPVHAMTMDNDRVELDVGDPAAPQPALPNGHLRAVWSTADVSTHDAKVPTYAFGLAVLIMLLVLAGAAVRPQVRS